MSDINSTVGSSTKFLVKHSTVCDDPWANTKAVKNSRYQLVTIDQWLASKDYYSSNDLVLGIHLLGEYYIDDIDILDHLEVFSLIEVEFASFTDGRGFSLATQLRQYGFKGELRATGDFLLDQLNYLQRCGFDAFEFDAQADITVIQEALAAFSHSYQSG